MNRDVMPRARLGRADGLARQLLIVGAAAVVALAVIARPVLGVPLLAVPPAVLLVQRCARDAVTALTVFVILLVAVPANLVVGPLASAGRPAFLFGLLCAWWWAHDRLLPDSGVARGLQPVRLAAGFLGAAVLASYAAAFARPIDGLETRGADRAALAITGLLGVVVLAADGIRDRDRLDVLLRRVVAAGAFLAVLGILQFGGVDVSGLFRIPFLTEHSEFQQVQIRSDLRRVAGTAAHPIEFGVVLALIFPFALHYAIHTVRSRALSLVPVALIGLAIPLSVSRSGTLAVAITGLAMWLTWSSRLRLISAGITVVLATCMRFVVPGLLGTIRSLFTNLGSDNSVAGRTEDYSVVGKYLSDAPLFGRGYGTFIPDRYVLLDNQYLGSLVETGIVGLVALVLFFAVGIAVARGSRLGADDETRSLAQALAAAVLASMVAAGTFDLLGFMMVAGFTALLIGCGGALWRLQRGVDRRTVEGTAARGGVRRAEQLVAG